LAGQLGWAIASAFAETDPAQRTALEHLLRDGEAGNIWAIIVHRLDRLGKKLSKLFVLMDRLETLAIDLRLVSEPSLLGPGELRRHIEMIADMVEPVNSRKARSRQPRDQAEYARAIDSTGCTFSPFYAMRRLRARHRRASR
jgi:DNA invertase Pin-like site-specific DNA recombinase